MKEVQIPKEQTLSEYLTVRVQLVYVKKSWFGYRDKLLSFSHVMPTTPQEAIDLFNKIAKANQKYGRTFQVE